MIGPLLQIFNSAAIYSSCLRTFSCALRHYVYCRPQWLHIEAKRPHLKLKASGLHWLINALYPLSLEYKVLLDNSVLKPTWMYSSQLWGNASNSNIDIVQRAQSKILRTITGAPWCFRNENILRDLNILPVKEVIAEQKEKYFTKLSLHPNHLARGLTRLSNQSRLRRNDLPTQRPTWGSRNATV